MPKPMKRRNKLPEKIKKGDLENRIIAIEMVLEEMDKLLFTKIEYLQAYAKAKEEKK